MTYELELTNKHIKFLFDDNENLNIFNLVRLFKSNINDYEISLNITGIKAEYQELIASNFSAFLTLYVKLIQSSQDSASFIYSEIRESLINKLQTEDGVIEEQGTFIYQYQKPQEDKGRSPHFVKNIRGAVLLSLVQDLLDNGAVGNKISIFDETSPLRLHSASTFLYNAENALMMWTVLDAWETEHEAEYKAEINRKIQESLKAKKELKSLAKKKLVDRSFIAFIEDLQLKIGLPNSIYSSPNSLQVWLVDDQHANGWYKLYTKMVPDSNVDITAFSCVDDINQQLHLSSFDNDFVVPDLALVDLRLSNSDQVIETYKAKDLSGFEVVYLLLDSWPGLPIMIASASSKLWNMEKAIEKGAVAYWRKSDEIGESVGDNAVLTAFDISLQFTEKFTLALQRVSYKYIFRIVESLIEKVSSGALKDSCFHCCIENYALELTQKTAWMCWKKTSDVKIIDSLLMGVMEIFNEIQPLLLNQKNNKLVVDPSVVIQPIGRNSDTQVINKTLDFLNEKYNIMGIDLASRYEKCKSIRNKLPIVHGSETTNDFKHATLEDIETALLIVWCLLNELGKKK